MASEQGGHPSKFKTPLLARTARLCRPKWQVTSCNWHAKLGTLHTKINCLLAILSFVRGAEGDGETSPPFATRYTSISAYRWSLRAQMARYFMQLACEVGHFTHGINYLLAILSFFRDAEGDGETSPPFATRCTSISAYSASL